VARDSRPDRASRPNLPVASRAMPAGIPSPGTITAIALAWGLLVWLNWFRANPLSIQPLRYALATWALVRPLPSLVAWSRHAALLAELGVLGLAAFGAGRAALVFLRAESRPLSGPNALALGAGALGLGTMGAGLAGLAFPGLARASVAAFGLLGLVALRRGMAGRLAALRGIFSGGSLPLSLAVVFALFVPLIGALAPEASFDGQAHHLAHPGLYAGHHKVFGVPWHFLAN